MRFFKQHSVKYYGRDIFFLYSYFVWLWLYLLAYVMCIMYIKYTYGSFKAKSYYYLTKNIYICTNQKYSFINKLLLNLLYSLFFIFLLSNKSLWSGQVLMYPMGFWFSYNFTFFFINKLINKWYISYSNKNNNLFFISRLVWIYFCL